VPLPVAAPVTFGSGEEGEAWRMDASTPGDILYGVATPVPPARSVYATLDVGTEIPRISVWNRAAVGQEFLPGTHWGSGITLLDRDRSIIRDLLAKSPGQLSPHLLAALLRGFFGGRSYVRLYNLGGSQGSRTSSVPFLQKRLDAIKGELLFC
jgi:hypothetical protein